MGHAKKIKSEFNVRAVFFVSPLSTMAVWSKWCLDSVIMNNIPTLLMPAPCPHGSVEQLVLGLWKETGEDRHWGRQLVSRRHNTPPFRLSAARNTTFPHYVAML